ncbi:MAG: universal stress protein, partial [Dehalococcoidales bacterium]
MFKRILVPLDGSQVSGRALQYAIEVAQHFGAEIILMKVVVPTSPFVSAEPATGLAGSPLTSEVAMKAAREE